MSLTVLLHRYVLSLSYCHDTWLAGQRYKWFGVTNCWQDVRNELKPKMPVFFSTSSFGKFAWVALLLISSDSWYSNGEKSISPTMVWYLILFFVTIGMTILEYARVNTLNGLWHSQGRFSPDAKQNANHIEVKGHKRSFFFFWVFFFPVKFSYLTCSTLRITQVQRVECSKSFYFGVYNKQILFSIPQYKTWLWIK